MVHESPASLEPSEKPKKPRRSRLKWLTLAMFSLLAFYLFGPDPWTRHLHAAVRGADRVLVRTGGTCHRHPENERILLETTDKTEIEAITSRLRVRRSWSWMHCMCCGTPTIEFYKGDKLLAMIGVHHGESLRWPGVWSRDAMLTAESRDQLNRWLQSIGAEP